jgi:hypothetical protein
MSKTKGSITVNVGNIYNGLTSVTKEVKKFNPADYRYYGISRPETDLEVKEWIEDNLFIFKEGKKRKVKVSRKMLEFICDFYFERERYGILWKNRGGSGTLSAGIIIFMKMLFQKAEITNMAGSGIQGRNVYKYVLNFITKCFPGLSEILSGKPTKKYIHLKNGAMLEVLNASEQEARGIHNRILFLDEACQKNPSIAPIMMSAMNTVYSEEGNMIVMLSTFHAEEVLFSDYWDTAESRGYKRYHWTIYDSMELCTMPSDHCKVCPLTRKVDVLDKRGAVIGVNYEGCSGLAHTSDGYMTYDMVLDVKIQHEGREEDFMIEHESKRPLIGAGLKYHAYDIYSCENMDYFVDTDSDDYFVIVGIDWGYDAQTAITAGEWPCYLSEEDDPYSWPRLGLDFLYYENRKGIQHILSILRKIEEKYDISKDRMIIRADASHPFENQEIINAGYILKSIPFNKYKEVGIKNVSMFLKHRMLIIYSKYKERNGVWEVPLYLSKYRQLPNGKYNKEDHIPDAVLCMLTKFNFISVYEDYLKIYKEEMLGE